MMSDAEDEFESLEYPPPNHYLSSVGSLKKLEEAITTAVRTKPLGKLEFDRFIDGDGRLIDEHGFRQAVFKGGVHSSIRKEVWKLLFGCFHCHSTRRERDILNLEMTAKYEALKQRWQSEIIRHESADDGDGNESTSDHARFSPSPSPRMLKLPQVENRTQQDFLAIQSHIYAERQPVSYSKLSDSVRSIDKDVPRTDRSHPLFKADDSIYLVMLRNVLITFAAFHEKVGYAQGMNDIASRFLAVMDNEADAYWCFTNFIERVQIEFLEEGMLKKLDLLRSLLREVDSDLYNYLNDCQVQDLAFCHRWLLLCFLREFSFEEGLRMFEIISSHHLEINSLEAEKAREMSRQNNAEQGSEISEYHLPTDSQLTFVLFVCVAILIMNRATLFSCTDVVSVFQCVNNLTKKMSVDEIVAKAEALFYAYCQKSVVENFQVLDTGASSEKL